MPSWTEKPHVIPTINVNLRPCSCFGNYANIGAAQATARPIHHDQPCREGSPVLIPCPIPRSVTFEVSLGKCSCEPMRLGKEVGGKIATITTHHEGCAGRPIRVSCSISGKTWEEGEVADSWPADDDGSGNLDGLDWPNELSACRARWALVKALVLGWNGEAVGAVAAAGGIGLDVIGPMFQQMRTVYSALCEMVRTEGALLAAQERMVNLLDSKRVTFRPPEEGARPSAQAMAVYVERLIEQVGVMS